MLCQPIHHRTEVERRRAHPIGQRAAVEIDAGTGEDLALTIQWQMIRELADEDMRNRSFGRQTALDQMGWGWSLGDTFGTGTAGIFRPDRYDDAELRWNDIQPLGAILSDPVHFAAPARTIQAFGFDHLLNPR